MRQVEEQMAGSSKHKLTDREDRQLTPTDRPTDRWMKKTINSKQHVINISAMKAMNLWIES